MYFNKDKLILNSINESAKILFKNFITSFKKFAKEFIINSAINVIIPGAGIYKSNPMQVLDDKLKMMLNEFNSHYKISKNVENKIENLIKNIDEQKLNKMTIINIKEIDKFIHLKYNMKSANKYNKSKTSIINKYNKYNFYNYFYRLLLDNDWKLLKQIDSFTIPQLICENNYIIFLSFDEYKIKKIFTLASEDMYNPNTTVKLIEIPFSDKIDQSEFRNK